MTKNLLLIFLFFIFALKTVSGQKIDSTIYVSHSKSKGELPKKQILSYLIIYSDSTFTIREFISEKKNKNENCQNCEERLIYGKWEQLTKKKLSLNQGDIKNLYNKRNNSLKQCRIHKSKNYNTPGILDQRFS
jgi:hypothetical protein